MRNIIKIELSRAFCNKWFLLALLIGSGLALWHTHTAYSEFARLSLSSAHATGTPPPSLFNNTLGMAGHYLPQTIFYFILPILAALPFADSFYTDQKSGVLKNIFTRAPKRQYYTAKTLAVFLSAAAVVLIPLLVGLLSAMMVFPATLVDPAGFNSSIVPDRMWYDLFYTNPYLYLFLFLFINAVFAGLLALLAPALTRFLRGRFLVLVAPFLVYFASNALFSYAGLPLLSPMIILQPGQNIGGLTFPLVLAIAGVLAVVTLGLFVVRGCRDETF